MISSCGLIAQPRFGYFFKKPDILPNISICPNQCAAENLLNKETEYNK